MPGAYNNLKSNYSVATNEGFALLSRMAGRDYESLPLDSGSGNINEDIMLDAIYGGAANPDEPQEYIVYSVDWLDESPEDVEEVEESEHITGEPVEDFTRYLNDNFDGWVYHHERGEVYVLNEQTDEGRDAKQTR